MVDVFGVCCRMTGSDTVLEGGGFADGAALPSVKVRRRPGVAPRIQKATERVIGKFCVLHERKEVECFIGLDGDITFCGGVLMTVKGAQ